MSDLKLDKETHDLSFEGNRIEFTKNIETIDQKIKVELLFLFGEWFLNTTEGVPYFDKVAVKNPQLSQIEALLRSKILSVEGVTEINSLILDFAAATRVLSISGKVKTTEGEIKINQDVTV